MTQLATATEPQINAIEKVLCPANVHAAKGREAAAARGSHDSPGTTFSIPGIQETCTNSRRLFAVAWSASFLLALKTVAARMKVNLPPDLAVDAEVNLGIAGGDLLLQAHFTVNLQGFEREFVPTTIGTNPPVSPVIH